MLPAFSSSVLVMRVCAACTAQKDASKDPSGCSPSTCFTCAAATFQKTWRAMQNSCNSVSDTSGQGAYVVFLYSKIVAFDHPLAPGQAKNHA